MSTAGSITSERGTLADSVLSRGISRYQYFHGKLHSRLLIVLGTYFAMCLVALGGGLVLLHGEALTLHGSVVAIGVSHSTWTPRSAQRTVRMWCPSGGTTMTATSGCSRSSISTTSV